MLDAVNGYKFGFSYHILNNNNMKSFFYYLTGCFVFRLQDIKWLWQTYFDKKQKLSKEMIKKIDDLNKHKKLINIEYQEFVKQSNNYL